MGGVGGVGGRCTGWPMTDIYIYSNALDQTLPITVHHLTIHGCYVPSSTVTSTYVHR